MELEESKSFIVTDESPGKHKDRYILDSSFDDEFKKNKIKIEQQQMLENKNNNSLKRNTSRSKLVDHEQMPISSSGGTHMVKKTSY